MRNIFNININIFLKKKLTSENNSVKSNFTLKLDDEKSVQVHLNCVLCLNIVLRNTIFFKQFIVIERKFAFNQGYIINYI